MFALLVVLRGYSDSFNLYNVAELSSGTELVGAAFKLSQGIKNVPSCTHVLYKTLNLVISRCCFAKDGEEMYQNL